MRPPDVETEGNRFPDVAENYHRNVISRGRAMLARVVERGIARGEFSPSAATDLPVVLAAPAVMAIVWKMVFERFDPIPLRNQDVLDNEFVFP